MNTRPKGTTAPTGPSSDLDLLHPTKQPSHPWGREMQQRHVVLAHVGPHRRGIDECLLQCLAETAGRAEVLRQPDHSDRLLEPGIIQTAVAVYDHDDLAGRKALVVDQRPDGLGRQSRAHVGEDDGGDPVEAVRGAPLSVQLLFGQHTDERRHALTPRLPRHLRRLPDTTRLALTVPNWPPFGAAATTIAPCGNPEIRPFPAPSFIAPRVLILIKELGLGGAERLVVDVLANRDRRSLPLRGGLRPSGPRHLGGRHRGHRGAGPLPGLDPQHRPPVDGPAQASRYWWGPSTFSTPTFRTPRRWVGSWRRRYPAAGDPSWRIPSTACGTRPEWSARPSTAPRSTSTTHCSWCHRRAVMPCRAHCSLGLKSSFMAIDRARTTSLVARREEHSTRGARRAGRGR